MILVAREGKSRREDSKWEPSKNIQACGQYLHAGPLRARWTALAYVKESRYLTALEAPWHATCVCAISLTKLQWLNESNLSVFGQRDDSKQRTVSTIFAILGLAGWFLLVHEVVENL